MPEAEADEALMLAFKAGQVRAFEELVRRHRGPVFNFLLRLTGQRARAEDLLQETWLKVARSAGTYEKRARFTTWLYTIARNLCVDASRRERYREADSLEQPAGASGNGRSLGERLPDASATPEREAHGAQLRRAIEIALARLPEDQREVFLLREHAGVPFKEIGEVTRAPENTVKSRMRYALEGLRKTLQELGIEGDMADEPQVSSATNR